MQDFIFYFNIGWEHIISSDALDHILFIIALCAIYQVQDWKKVLILVTAFTIRHSLTLALSVLDIIRFPTRIVEILIPCTIVITALSNLFQRNITHRSVRINYFLALIFGLIHGMGFANTIRVVLARDQSIGIGLFGFNVGLEVGQIVVVGVLLLLAYVFVTLLKVPRREWVIFLSAGVFGLALMMVLKEFLNSISY